MHSRSGPTSHPVRPTLGVAELAVQMNHPGAGGDCDLTRRMQIWVHQGSSMLRRGSGQMAWRVAHVHPTLAEGVNTAAGGVHREIGA
uniref:Uncharacterized protein n=1 Tax=Rhodococcus erythropolis TaxID=1833 RepID=O30681_RHOER|nr:ORF1 [Rhodococcus erythropolis]